MTLQRSGGCIYVADDPSTFLHQRSNASVRTLPSVEHSGHLYRKNDMISMIGQCVSIWSCVTKSAMYGRVRGASYFKIAPLAPVEWISGRRKSITIKAVVAEAALRKFFKICKAYSSDQSCKIYLRIKTATSFNGCSAKKSCSAHMDVSITGKGRGYEFRLPWNSKDPLSDTCWKFEFQYCVMNISHRYLYFHHNHAQ